MKCFVHIEKEAIAACRQCGKGMCEDCSAYSGHTGVCPECRLKEFKAEVAQKLQENKELKRDFILRIVKSVLLCWLLLIPVLVGLVVCLKLNKQMKENEERIAKLNTEIAKLEGVLSQRGGAAFV